ncbi:dihydrofolate reductase family protein [Blastococcus sp. CT_GayMR16]|uniref:dihydrofolate reductase family protein n=1 Tax=Blastococcus sp. CT_GayMR16 TaxID=2559607 RepID=UPI001073256A|nr:dihydrofolate reductase family protein [Blastococcus sp. CT_GayMR16]TFV88904.1 dihydrofolate reductase [Blastococcus sp. CT_GayMR16]
MRRIVQMTSVSLDGFFEGPGGNLDWHLVDDEVHQEFNDVLGAMSTFLDGRVTHELMAEFWPTADADPDSSPPMAEFARIWRDMPKVVFSRSLEHADWNSTVVRDVDPAEIRRLQAQPGGDMAVGGARLADAFRRLDLIDEYRIYVHPVLLGEGTPLFRPAERPVGLRLLETRAFGNGVVLLRYERAGSGGG